MSTGVGTKGTISVGSRRSLVTAGERARRDPPRTRRRCTATEGGLHCPHMLLNPFARRGDPHLLAVSMIGVKMGDRVGICRLRARRTPRRGGRKGRPVRTRRRHRAGRGVRRARPQGRRAAPACSSRSKSRRRHGLPLDDRQHRSRGRRRHGRPAGSDGRRRASVASVTRNWRGFSGPAAAPSSSGRRRRPASARLLTGRTTPGRRLSDPDAANQTLQADGFGSVRTLAEREGLVFVEGIKPRGQRAEAQGCRHFASALALCLPLTLPGCTCHARSTPMPRRTTFSSEVSAKTAEKRGDIREASACATARLLPR